MSEPIIRTLRKSDYPALIDVVRRMWYPEYDEKTGLLAAETDWENCLARATCAFTAELDGKPIALILGRIALTRCRCCSSWHSPRTGSRPPEIFLEFLVSIGI